MIIVFVRHYLTVEGLDYFTNQWFPKVYKIMSQQKGFISLVHDKEQDYADCVNVTVKFKDKATLELWGYSPEHDALVDSLDVFRSRNYWEYSIIDNEQTEMNWQKVIPVEHQVAN